MNPRDPHHEIGDLLRSQQPDPQPSPGLEMRILRALPLREKASRRIWPWFLLPPAVAMGVVMFWPKPEPRAIVTQQPKPGAEESITTFPAEEIALTINPLEREKAALQRDARRAGRFLIDCLPSLGGNE